MVYFLAIQDRNLYQFSINLPCLPLNCIRYVQYFPETSTVQLKHIACEHLTKLAQSHFIVWQTKHSNIYSHKGDICENLNSHIIGARVKTCRKHSFPPFLPPYLYMLTMSSPHPHGTYILSTPTCSILNLTTPTYISAARIEY